MNKKNMLVAAIIAIGMGVTGVAFGGFDKTPGSAIRDRQETLAAVQATAESMEKLLEETKKTNDLLQQLIKINKK